MILTSLNFVVSGGTSNSFSGVLGTLLLQAPTDAGNGTLMLVFVGIAAISLLVLALVVVGTLIALTILGLKAKASLEKTMQEVKGRAYPLIEKSTTLVSDLTPTIKSIVGKTDTLVGDLSPTIKGITEKTHALIEELSPKIAGITDDFHGITSRGREMADVGKQKLEELSPAITAARDTFMQANATVRSANEKTKRQVDRVDGLVNGVIDWTNRIPDKLGNTLGVPGRKLDEAATRIKVESASLVRKSKNLWAAIANRLGGRKVPVSALAVTDLASVDAPTRPTDHEDAFAIG